MTKPPNQEQFIVAGQHRTQADGRFLRRILFGLIAAAFISGAVTVALTSQHDLLSERFEVATTQGPA